MEKLHYYYFVFFYQHESGSLIYRTACMGLKEPKVTAHLIVAARKLARVTPDAIMLSCSSLGYMTAEEFGNPAGGV